MSSQKYGKPSKFGVSSDPWGRNQQLFTVFPHTSDDGSVTLFAGHHDAPPPFGGLEFASFEAANIYAGQASLTYGKVYSRLLGG